MREQAAKAHQQQARFMQAEAEQHLGRFVPGTCLKVPAYSRIDQINELTIIGLLVIVNDFANQKVDVKLALQGFQPARGAPV